MNKSLEELAHIYNGTGYKNNPAGDKVPIYGTGGLMGYTSMALYTGPAVLSGRKGSINNPMYVEGEFWNVDTIFCIKANEGIHTKWLYYNFLNTDLSSLNEATGVPSVTSKALYKLKFKWFEYREQCKISSILSVCDSLIEKTQAAIAKYKAIKQGMLHDLFTRGIDLNTGKLRPKYEDAPALYKKSKLGMVPQEWDVASLEDSRVEIIDGDRGVNYPKEQDFIEAGYCLFLSATNVSKDGFKFVTKQFITKEKDDLLGTGKLKREDVIVTTRGTVGNVVFYSNEVPYDNIRINSGMIILRNGDTQIKNLFLYHFVKEYLFEIYYKIAMSGSAQPQLPIKDFKKFLLIYPHANEQDLIIERLTSINKKLQTEQTYLLKLQQIKAGLMSDLLSGKKRVTVAEEVLDVAKH